MLRLMLRLHGILRLWHLGRRLPLALLLLLHVTDVPVHVARPHSRLTRRRPVPILHSRVTRNDKLHVVPVPMVHRKAPSIVPPQQRHRLDEPLATPPPTPPGVARILLRHQRIQPRLLALTELPVRDVGDGDHLVAPSVPETALAAAERCQLRDLTGHIPRQVPVHPLKVWSEASQVLMRAGHDECPPVAISSAGFVRAPLLRSYAIQIVHACLMTSESGRCGRKRDPDLNFCALRNFQSNSSIRTHTAQSDAQPCRDIDHLEAQDPLSAPETRSMAWETMPLSQQVRPPRDHGER